MGRRRPITFPFFGDGIFKQEGPAWEHSRELLRPQFQHWQDDDMALFEDTVQDLFTALDKEIKKGNGVVDLQPLFHEFTLDTTSAFLLGESVKSLLEPEVEEGKGEVGEQSFAQAFNTAHIYIQKRYRLGNFYWASGGRKFRAACKLVNGFADQLIDRGLNWEKKDFARDGERSKYVFLDSVAEKVKARDALGGQAVSILTAGRDTTAAIMSWVL
jgi:cytochrome P450